VSSATARRGALTFGLFAIVVIGAAAAGYLLGRSAADRVREVMSAAPPAAPRIAFVREEPCDGGQCQTLWIGTAREDAEQVAALRPQGERVEAIAWAQDGYRMGFLINGYQLRVFDAESRKPVAEVNLIEPSGDPTTRIARGITFSQNGAAVTFDDCPRHTSGCKSGLAAIR
jgi:hypothetical protein